MGQQQLLLLVLGIVIVGLAVVVGIQAFGENQKKANADALVADAVRIASDAQAWNLKPAAFGGGGGAFTTLTLEKLGYTVTGSGASATYTNLNGEFTLTVDSATQITIDASSITNSGNDNAVEVVVSGTTPNAIQTTVSTADDAASS